MASVFTAEAHTWGKIWPRTSGPGSIRCLRPRLTSTDADTRREAGPRTLRRSLTSIWRPCTIFTASIGSLWPRLASTNADPRREAGSLTSADAHPWRQSLGRAATHTDPGRQTRPWRASTHCNTRGQPRTAGGHWPRAPGHTHTQPRQPRANPGLWLSGAANLDTQPRQPAHVWALGLTTASLNLYTAVKY